MAGAADDGGPKGKGHKRKAVVDAAGGERRPSPGAPNSSEVSILFAVPCFFEWRATETRVLRTAGEASDLFVSS
jgi:hypothetical protein